MALVYCCAIYLSTKVAAVVADIGEHFDNDRSRDVYERLYEALEVDPPRGSP